MTEVTHLQIFNFHFNLPDFPLFFSWQVKHSYHEMHHLCSSSTLCTWWSWSVHGPVVSGPWVPGARETLLQLGVHLYDPCPMPAWDIHSQQRILPSQSPQKKKVIHWVKRQVLGYENKQTYKVDRLSLMSRKSRNLLKLSGSSLWDFLNSTQGKNQIDWEWKWESYTVKTSWIMLEVKSWATDRHRTYTPCTSAQIQNVIHECLFAH